jgi:soluble lytic murein transglycosylase
MLNRMRRALLALPLLLAPLTAAAQPWAGEPARVAGRQALAAAISNRFAEAETLATTADPVARKLVTWLRLQARGSGATAFELVAWVEANPDWPQPETLIRRAEEALAAEPDDALALRHFTRNAPRTVEGAQRFADALSRTGRGREATAVLRAAWRASPPSDAFLEGAFAERNAAILTTDDHWARFDRLLWANQAGAAGRLVSRLDSARRAVAEARLAFRGDREAEVPRARDIGLVHDRARMLRRKDRDAEAAAVWAAGESLQANLPPEAARAIWAERQILARKLLRLGDAAAAYRLAAAHGQAEPGEPRQEGEFLAGFIALRRLNDAANAERHFQRVGEGSRSVITRARAGYWTGLALAARRQEAPARERMAEAAAFPVAFYGQLASLALGESPAQLSARINAAALPEPPADAARLFGARELSRAVVTLADLGAPDRARTFLLRLEDVAAEASDRWLIARLAVFIGRRDHAVWVARRAGADGVILLEDGWPTPYATPSDGAEPALVNAITRQESNFELGAVSSANARGPMQLLPSTAQSVARRLGIPHSTAMLTSDAAHNLRLGSAYINDMLARYGGAMPLAAAAYNAGPGRVEEWLGTYGDPRIPGGIHILDWIEGIPFSETRNYVQRVIENVVVYRARNPATADLPHPLLSLLEGRP